MSGTGDRSFSSIFGDIVTNVQGIIRSEVRLARTEIQEEAVKAGKASAILGAGIVLGLYALGFLLVTWLYALETAVSPWLAALIVTVLVGGAAALLMKAGLKRIKRVDPRPDQAIQTMKENLEWVKNQNR